MCILTRDWYRMCLPTTMKTFILYKAICMRGSACFKWNCKRCTLPGACVKFLETIPRYCEWTGKREEAECFGLRKMRLKNLKRILSARRHAMRTRLE